MSVELIETHISWVFLAGDFVLKVKRPVDLGFVDHTSLSHRRQSCEDEVRLNRRMTEGVYLDVVPIMRDRDGYAVEGIGPAVEWGVLMRRLPDREMLNARLEQDRLDARDWGAVVARLIAFHRDQAQPCVQTEFASSEAQTAVVQQNLNAISAFGDRCAPDFSFHSVVSAIAQFEETRRELLEKRVADGWIRDGHGDLRCEHICLEAGAAQIFDCVEFSPAIRCADIASDLSFLLLDLRRLGRADLSRELASRYRDAGIPLPPGLLRYYGAHRALVRAKVETIARMNSNSADHPYAAIRNYHHLAFERVVRWQRIMIVITGLSGTGKSTIAVEIAALTGGQVMRTDVVRQTLAGADHSESFDWQTGPYALETTNATYAELFRQAESALRDGVIPILDGAFLEQWQRDQASELAERNGVPLVFVETICRDDVAKSRMEARARAGRDPSAANWMIHQRQRDSFRGMRSRFPAPIFESRIDTTVDRVDLMEQFVELVVQANLAVPGAGLVEN